MKRRVSLSQITIAVQVTLFAVVLSLAVLMGFYFQRHTVEEETAAREAELTARIRDLESRFSADALQVREMLHSVLDNEGLWSEDQSKKYFGKVAVKNLMNDKLLLYDDLGTMFVCRKDDFYMGIFSGQQTGTEKLADQGVAKLPEAVQVIIVGIDTCLETRGSELWPPYPVDKDFVLSHGNPLLANVETTGDMYAEFVVKYLKPMINEEFQTIADAAHTGIGRSSMEGLESFYMAMRYPDVFGRCLCFSPAFRCHKLSFELEELDKYDYSKIRDNRFFLYNGYETVDYTATESTWEFFAKMHAKGMDYQHVALTFDTRQPHFEPAWGKYFLEAVSYLFSEDNSVIMPPAQSK